MIVQQAFCAVLGRSYTAAIRTLRLMEVTHTHVGQDRDKNLLSQLQKLKTEKKDIEEDVRQMVLMMEDRRAELTKQREGYEQVRRSQALSPAICLVSAAFCLLQGAAASRALTC